MILPIFVFSQSTKKLKRRTYSNQFYDLTEKNNLQLESFMIFENNEDVDNYFLPDIRIRYGLHEDLEIFSDLDFLYNQEQKYGFIPFGFGFKVNVTEEKKYIPDIAFVTSLQFGNLATKKYKIDKIMPLIGVILNKQVSEKINFEFDYFMQWIDDDSYQTHILDFNTIYQINEKVALSSGLNFYSDETDNNNLLLDFGFTYQKKATAYSFEFGHKLFSKNLNYFIGLGITQNLNFNN